ncbi:MAG: dipeptide epimerase, partial [Halolamina sp.]
IESNTSIAASVHMGPLLDYADLDGSLLLESDPYDGVDLAEGVMRLAELGLPGTGARTE